MPNQKLKLFLHSDKDRMYEKADELIAAGTLNDDVEAVRKFSYALSEVALDCIVGQSGGVMIVGINGVPLKEPVKG